MCPKDEILSAFIDGEIGSPWGKRLEGHIKGCDKCRQKVQQLRGLSELFAGDAIRIKDSMARVKKRIDLTIANGGEGHLSETHYGPSSLSFWRKQVMVPMPVLAAGFTVLFVLVASVFFFIGRNDTQTIRTAAESEPQPNVHVYYQMDNPELLRKILSDKQFNEETVIQLPQENDFTIIGEPKVKRLGDSRGQ